MHTHKQWLWICQYKPEDEWGMSAMLDSELWECPGLLTILLHLLVVLVGRSHTCLTLCPLGRSRKVSLRNVVISCSTRQAAIFKAYGHSDPFSFTVPNMESLYHFYNVNKNKDKFCCSHWNYHCIWYVLYMYLHLKSPPLRQIFGAPFFWTRYVYH